MRKTKTMKLAILAIGAAALAMWTAGARAEAIPVSRHFLSANTSVSEGVSQRADAVDDTRFTGTLASVGLGVQGAIASATASQDILFDAQRGASGFMEVSMAFDSSIRGNAESLLDVAFDIADRSTYELDGLAQLDGSGGAAFRHLRLLLDVIGGDLVEIFDVDFSASAFKLDGLLEPGRYLLSVRDATGDFPGTNTDIRSRIDFDFHFAAVPGGVAVPEPGSLALTATALVAVARISRRRGGQRVPAC